MCIYTVLVKSIILVMIVILVTVPFREDFPPRKHCSEESARWLSDSSRQDLKAWALERRYLSRAASAWI